LYLKANFETEITFKAQAKGVNHIQATRMDIAWVNFPQARGAGGFPVERSRKKKEVWNVFHSRAHRS
jgi:hypothetical protein